MSRIVFRVLRGGDIAPEKDFDLALLRDARLKLDRALKHIAEADDLLSNAMRINPPTAKVARITYDDRGLPMAEWEGSVPAAPDSAGAIIGDAVHNLRAALDLSVAELARLNERSDRNVYFPFASSDAEFGTAINSSNIRKCGQAVVSVVKDLKPYTGGNNLLRTLHELDRMDKHRAILPRCAVDMSRVRPFFKFFPEEGNIATSVEFRDMEFVAPTFVFPDGTGLQGRVVAEGLTALHQVAVHAVEALETCIPDR